MIKALTVACSVISILFPCHVFGNEREQAVEIFRNSLALHVEDTDIDAYTKRMSSSGYVLDIMLPSDGALLYIFSSGKNPSSGLPKSEKYTRVLSAKTCGEHSKALKFIRFFHVGSLAGGMQEILETTKQSGLLIQSSNDGLPKGFVRYALSSKVNEGTNGPKFKINIIEGELTEHGYLLNYEAIINFPCDKGTENPG